MTYYTPDNPNHALVPRIRKRPVLGGLRVACIVLLSLLLACALTLTLCIASVRFSITPEYVYRYADGLDYADFPLPVDGSFMSISQLMLQSFNEVGFNLTEADIDLLFDQFSIPVILAGFAQDVTSWLLFHGSRPVLIPEEIAAIALSSVEQSILQILHILGDPVALLGDMLATPLSTLDTNGLFDKLEPVQKLLSADTFAVLVSVCAMLAVLLFCLCRVSVLRLCLPAGISLFGTGLLLTAAGAGVPLLIPTLTTVYQSYLQSFLQPVTLFLWRGALFCCLAGVILAGLWLAGFLLSKNASAAVKNNDTPAAFSGENRPHDGI